MTKRTESEIFASNMQVFFGKDYTERDFHVLIDAHRAIIEFADINSLPLDMKSWSAEYQVMLKLSI